LQVTEIHRNCPRTNQIGQTCTRVRAVDYQLNLIARARGYAADCDTQPARCTINLWPGTPAGVKAHGRCTQTVCAHNFNAVGTPVDVERKLGFAVKIKRTFGYRQIDVAAFVVPATTIEVPVVVIDFTVQHPVCLRGYRFTPVVQRSGGKANFTVFRNRLGPVKLRFQTDKSLIALDRGADAGSFLSSCCIGNDGFDIDVAQRGLVRQRESWNGEARNAITVRVEVQIKGTSEDELFLTETYIITGQLSLSRQ